MKLRDLLLPRTFEDMAAQRIRVSIGGVDYTLPVQSIERTRVWEESLEDSLIQLLVLVSRDDGELDGLVRALAESAWPFIDLLLDYDSTSVLPDAQTIAETETEWGLMLAVLEVWRAAHPLADIGVALTVVLGLKEGVLKRLTSLLYPNGVSGTPTSKAG